MNELSNNQINIGETLRNAREQAGLSLADAALHANLRQEIIVKIEENAFSSIGAPVFTRGYISIYARYLNQDEHALLKAFDGQKNVQPELKLTPVNITNSAKEIRSERHFSLFYLLLIFICIGFLAVQLLFENSWLSRFIQHNFGERGGEQVLDLPNIKSTDTHQIDLTQPPVVTEEKDISLPIIQQLSPDHGFSESVRRESASADRFSGEDSRLTENPSDISTESASSELSASDDASRLNEGVVDEIATSNAADKQSEQGVSETVSVAYNSGVSLIFNADCWAEFRDADGVKIGSRVYHSGERLDFKDKQLPVNANIGNPQAVSLQIGGKNYALDDYRIKGTKYFYRLVL